ncbi:DUF4190 domain-containing protein [Pseudofrankia asymbiotica]|uniref:DUF4190 domain-containing protein n=1 Tax=Pseudofrankia asymbiotica TaxID=1834516 RepID=A0A1V2I545_9ACTN|nr:DUF4190 domain-containing protein [Pseudofrankia asymbiotica]ONH25975.1 hypothetical protein BL253_26045 [Pseudofrankia asymbiotica]
MTRPTSTHDAANSRVTDSNPFVPPDEGTVQNTGGQAAPHAGYPVPPADQTGYMPYPESGQDQYGRSPYSYGAAPVGESSGVRTLWILGFVLGALGVVVPFAGVAGIVCGAVAWGKRSSRGKAATIVAIVCTLIGVALGIMVYV